MQLLPPDEMERLDSMLADYPLSVILRGLQEITLENATSCDSVTRAKFLHVAAQAVGIAARDVDRLNV